MSAPFQIGLLYRPDPLRSHHIKGGAHITGQFFTEPQILPDTQFLSLRIQHLARHLHQLSDFSVKDKESNNS